MQVRGLSSPAAYQECRGRSSESLGGAAWSGLASWACAPRCGDPQLAGLAESGLYLNPSPMSPSWLSLSQGSWIIYSEHGCGNPPAGTEEGYKYYNFKILCMSMPVCIQSHCTHRAENVNHCKGHSVSSTCIC